MSTNQVFSLLVMMDTIFHHLVILVNMLVILKILALHFRPLNLKHVRSLPAGADPPAPPADLGLCDELRFFKADTFLLRRLTGSDLSNQNKIFLQLVKNSDFNINGDVPNLCPRLHF